MQKRRLSGERWINHRIWAADPHGDCLRSAETTPPPQPMKLPGPQEKPQIINTSANASSVVAGVVVPSGSTPVSQLSATGLEEPAQRPACTPQIDVSKFWIVPGSYRALHGFLQSHPPAGMLNTGHGTWGGANGDGSRRHRRPSWRKNEYINARVEHGATDAALVPSHADCESSPRAVDQPLQPELRTPSNVWL